MNRVGVRLCLLLLAIWRQAFSITKKRTEVIFQGTRNHSIVPDEDGGIWEEYEFKCKPGNIMRRPCAISPYHYRLDWLMWFAAFQVSAWTASGHSSPKGRNGDAWNMSILYWFVTAKKTSSILSLHHLHTPVNWITGDYLYHSATDS